MSDAASTISVIAPCFNAAPWLRRCIHSALACPRVAEFIVVDDGSSDDSAAIVAALASDRPGKLRYVRQDNAGAAAARSRGQSMATGDWLLFLDADDEVSPEGLEALVQASHDFDAVFGNVEMIDAESLTIGTRNHTPPLNHPVASLFFGAPLTGSIILRRTRAGSYWNSAHQAVDDFFFHARNALMGLRFHHVPVTVLRYRQHESPTRLSQQGFDYASALGRAFLELDDARTEDQQADGQLSGYLHWIFLDLGTRTLSEPLRRQLLSRSRRTQRVPLREIGFAWRWYRSRGLARMLRGRLKSVQRG